MRAIWCHKIAVLSLVSIWSLSVLACSLVETGHCVPVPPDSHPVGPHAQSDSGHHHEKSDDHSHGGKPSGPASSPCDEEVLCVSLESTWHSFQQFTFGAPHSLLYIQLAFHSADGLVLSNRALTQSFQKGVELCAHEVCTLCAIYGNAPPA